MELYYIKGVLKDHNYRDRIAKGIVITFYKERPRDVREYLTKHQYEKYQTYFPLDERTYEKQANEAPQPNNYFTFFLRELLTKAEAEEILRFLNTQSDFTKLRLAVIDISDLREFYKFGFTDRINDRKGEYWRFNHKGTKNVYFKGYADYKDFLEHDFTPNVISDDGEQPKNSK